LLQLRGTEGGMTMTKRATHLFIAFSLITLLASQQSLAKSSSIPKINSIVEFTGSWEEIGKQQAYYFPEMTI